MPGYTTLYSRTPRSFLFAVVANVGPGGTSRCLAVAYRQHHDEYNSQISWDRVQCMVTDTLALTEVLSDPTNRAPLEAERALAEDWYRRSQGREPPIHERPSVPDTAQPPFVPWYKRREPGQQQPPLPWWDDAPSKFPFTATCVLLALLRDTRDNRTRPSDVQFQPLSTLFRADCIEYGLVILDISDLDSGVKYGIVAFPMNYMAEVEYGGEMIGWDPVEDPQPEKEPDVVLADPRPRELLSISQWVSKHYYWSGLEKASCILKLEERPLADAVALDYIWPPELDDPTRTSSEDFRHSMIATQSPPDMEGYTIVDQPPQNDPVGIVRTIDDLLVLTQEPASGPLEKEALANLQVLAQFREQLRQRLEEAPERLGSSQISSHVLRVAYAGCRHLNWVVFGNLPPRVIAAAIASDELQGASALSLCLNPFQLVGDEEDGESDLGDLAAALAQSTALQQLCFLQQPDRNSDDGSAHPFSELSWLWSRASSEDSESLRLRTIHSTSALLNGLRGREVRAISSPRNLGSSFTSGAQVVPMIHLFTFVSPQREDVRDAAADHHVVHPARPGYSGHYSMDNTGLNAESFAVRFLVYLRSLGPDSDPDQAILRFAYHGAFSSLASIDEDNKNNDDDEPASPPRGPPPRPPPLQSWPDQLGVRPIPAGFFDELAPDHPSRDRLRDISPGSWVVLIDRQDRRDRFSDDRAFLQYSFIRIRRSPASKQQKQQQRPAPVSSSVEVVGGLTDFLRETVPETDITTWEKRLEEVEMDLVSALTRPSPPSTPSSMEWSPGVNPIDEVLRRLTSPTTESADNAPPETDLPTEEGLVVEGERERCIGVRVMAESRVHTLLDQLLRFYPISKLSSRPIYP